MSSVTEEARGGRAKHGEHNAGLGDDRDGMVAVLCTIRRRGYNGTGSATSREQKRARERAQLVSATFLLTTEGRGAALDDVESRQRRGRCGSDGARVFVAAELALGHSCYCECGSSDFIAPRALRQRKARDRARFDLAEKGNRRRMKKESAGGGTKEGAAV